jgi:hypothetical protein
MNLAQHEMFNSATDTEQSTAPQRRAKAVPSAFYKTACGKITSQETIGTTFTKTCATSSFSASTEALPTPRDRKLERAL